VAANIAEAWRKRRYPAAFRSKLNDAESEAAETQVWLDIMLDCEYITADEHAQADAMYHAIIGQLVATGRKADSFCRLT
jgi:four helix bundle protein